MTVPRRPVRMLHTADLHLGSGARFRDCPAAAECTCALHGVRTIAALCSADVVVIAGDLFDHARVRPSLVAEVVQLLGEISQPVLLASGNHDVATAASVLAPFRADLDAAGVIVLDGSVTLLDGALTCWGRAMPEHSPSFRPLLGASGAERASDAWYVVVGHGHAEPLSESLEDSPRHSSPISPTDIATTGADYVALGHWHHAADVSAGTVPAWYPGSPSAAIGTGTVLQVDLHPEAGCTITSVRLADVVFEGCAAHRATARLARATGTGDNR